MNQTLLSFAFVSWNFVACFGIFIVCLCRLHVMNKNVLLRVRLEYALYIGGSWVAGLSPMWGEWPEWGSATLATVFFVGLLLGGIGWREGPPESTTSPAPLGDN